MGCSISEYGALLLLRSDGNGAAKSGTKYVYEIFGFTTMIQTCRKINYETERDLMFTQPCHQIVEATFLHWLDTLIVVQSFLAVFTLISLIGSSCWIRSLRRAAIRESCLNPSNSHNLTAYLAYQPIDQDDTESIRAN